MPWPLQLFQNRQLCRTFLCSLEHLKTFAVGMVKIKVSNFIKRSLVLPPPLLYRFHDASVATSWILGSKSQERFDVLHTEFSLTLSQCVNIRYTI